MSFTRKFAGWLVFLSLIPSWVLAGEKDLYDFLWLDPDKSVYVLQNKIYPKDKSLYLDIGYVMGLSSSFQDTNGGQLKLGYFFSEEWALELNHIQYNNSDNAAHKSVKFVTGTVPFVRRPLTSTSLFLVYSPFYGKINTFNQIYYFDWSVGFGTGAYQMESNLKSASDTTKDTFDQESYTPIQLKTTVKFHINKHIHLGLEFLNTNYQAGTPKNPNTKSWDQNNDLIFNLGVSF